MPSMIGQLVTAYKKEWGIAMKKYGRMTDKDLNIIMQEQVGKLADLGYDVSFFKSLKFHGIKATNLHNSLGRCKYSYNKEHKYIISQEITISKHLAKWEYIDILKNTVMHECIHVLTPQFKKTEDGGHGKEWTDIANAVNNAYGYNVKRYYEGDWEKIKREDAKYKLEYTYNGKNYEKYYYRKTDVVESALSSLPLYVDKEEISYTIYVLR